MAPIATAQADQIQALKHFQGYPLNFFLSWMVSKQELRLSFLWSLWLIHVALAVLLIDSLSASILQEMAHSWVAYTKCHPLLSYQPRYFSDTESEQSLPRRQFKETKMAMNGLLQMLKSWMQCSCKKAIVMKTLTNNKQLIHDGILTKSCA